MFILGLQGEGQLCEVIFVMSYTQGCRRRGRSAVAPGMGEQAFPVPPSYSHASFLPAFRFASGLQIRYFWLKQSEACFAASTLEAGSSKNNILRMRWSLKELSEGSWSPRAQTPAGPISLPLWMPLLQRLQKGSLWSSHRLPGARNGPPGGLSSLGYWLQLTASHLTAWRSSNSFGSLFAG